MTPDEIVLKIMTWPYVKTFIPLFLLLIGFEWYWSVRKQKSWYRVNDAMSSLSCGIFSQLTNIVFRSASLFLYVYFFEKYSIYDFTHISWQGKVVVMVLVFLACDLAYYWFHRYAHEINLGWAGHVVHHQSEEYNFTTALRQSSTQWIFSNFFHLPLAIVGIPIEWQLGMMGINVVYQFFIHTRAVGRFHPWIEWIFNTPSHHRVHHARNPKYLDRNYAGTLIIWDRMFGTFQVEEEEPVYGIVNPLKTFNPFKAQVYYYVVLWQDMLAAPHWMDKLKLWFKQPGWRPQGLTPYPQPPELDRATAIKFDPAARHKWLAMILFLVGLAAAVPVLFMPGAATTKLIPIMSVLFVLSLAGMFSSGMVFRRR